VEIITQKGHTPSRDWLSFTKSSRARNRIKHWLNEHEKERATETGRKLLEREARRHKAAISKVTEAEYAKAAAEFGVSSTGDLLAGVGYGKLSARAVLHKLIPETVAAVVPDAGVEAGAATGSIGAMSDAVKRVFFGRGSESLLVEGQDDLLVYRARCCNPIRGEEIVGYVTRGKGVAVHARNCPNVQNLLYESDRRIEVDWARTPELDGAGGAKTYPVKLILHCDDRQGLLKELTAVISDDGTNIRSVDSKPDAEGTGALVEFVVETRDVRHLNRLVTALRRISGVREVQRMHKI
jgi:GTP pyrophosphokinase